MSDWTGDGWESSWTWDGREAAGCPEAIRLDNGGPPGAAS